MEKFALIGYPLGHSMSALIHKELFKLNGIDSSYELMEISPGSLKDNIEDLKKYAGFNVTIPYKVDIIPYLDCLSQRAQLFGSVNTVKSDGGVLSGHNTDCFGFLRAAEAAGIKLGGKTLLCGSGGVSRMFAFESILAKADLTIAVRDSDIPAANEIKKEINEKLKKDARVITLDQVNGEYDVLINGTPVGMYPNTDCCVLPREKVQKCAAVFDAVYNPVKTLLIKYAEEANARCSNGLPMLVWQAAVAQEIWLGVKFDNEQINRVIAVTERELEKI